MSGKEFRCRIRFETQGGHVLARVYAGVVPADGKDYTLPSSGTLVFRAGEEWEAARGRLSYLGAVYEAKRTQEADRG